MRDAVPTWLGLVALIAAGSLLLQAGVELLAALSTEARPLSWWLLRATGLQAYAAFFAAMLTGVFVGGRGAGGLIAPATALRHHRPWALAASVATLAHVVLVALDPHAGVGALGALLPLASPSLRGPVALGVLATWLVGAVVVTTALSRRLGRDTWRGVHGLSFGAFLLALVHGVTAGTDTSAPAVRLLYLLTAVLLLGAVLQRALLAAIPPQAEATRGRG